VREGYASKTAEHNALFRALHTSSPAADRIFEDRLAASFLTWPLNLVARLAVVPGWRSLAEKYIDSRWPGMRASVVARTALIDKWIAECAGQNLQQLVVLGAGYDTRAYRLACLKGLTVFEVDHPATQTAKLHALERTLPPRPNVRYVASDLARDRLMADIVAAGFDRSPRTLILWEGVTNYLTESAVDGTLEWCGRAAPGGVLIFTYVDRRVLTCPELFAGADRLLSTLSRVDENLTFGLHPGTARDYLAARGIRLELDLAASDYRALYLKAKARSIRGHEFYHAARGRILAPADRPDSHAWLPHVPKPATGGLSAEPD